MIRVLKTIAIIAGTILAICLILMFAEYILKGFVIGIFLFVIYQFVVLAWELAG